MAELFKGYENDFSKYIASANKKIALLPSAPKPDAILAEARHDIQDAEHWLRQMESEILTMPAQLSSQYQPRLKRHQENLLQLKKSLSSEQTRKNKVDLMGKTGPDSREKLLNSNEILQESGDTLERTYRLGLESEQIASDALGNLKGQRVQIQKINEKVNDVGSNVNKANRVIGSMNRRRIWMKIIMLIIIVLLMVACAVALYIKVG
ncbi:unnamed protein product [Blepharisma stoltei]|uniref:Vesicle transport v-SNARE N-terminal domain-containing protein n=1 Tax=Blepharisma stoltei TaxID=1481888 RepID=A0AAU9IK16_9CILI|nr:unnamed protein product [Blepharisma stoltei]